MDSLTQLQEELARSVGYVRPSSAIHEYILAILTKINKDPHPTNLLLPATDLRMIDRLGFERSFARFLSEAPKTYSDSTRIPFDVSMEEYEQIVQNEALMYQTYRQYHARNDDLTIRPVIDSINREMGVNYRYETQIVEVLDSQEYSKIKGEISERFQRDHIIVFSDSARNYIVPKFSPLGQEYQRDSLSALRLSDTCSVNMAFSNLPKLDIQGGNMITFERVAIIGKEELWGKYVNTPLTGTMKDRLRSLDVAYEGKTEEELVIHVTDSIRARLGVDHVFWFGYDSPMPGHMRTNPGRKYHQPIYHIDLFITPVRLDQNSRTLTLIVGIPKMEYASFSIPGRRVRNKAKKIICEISENIDKAMKTLESNLKDNGFLMDTLQVPLPIRFQNTPLIETFSPICNGLIEENNGVLIYYMPIGIGNQEIERIATGVYSKRVQRVVKVRAVYGNDSGLRCRMVPFERK